jgi:hypothetical protein
MVNRFGGDRCIGGLFDLHGGRQASRRPNSLAGFKFVPPNAEGPLNCSDAVGELTAILGVAAIASGAGANASATSKSLSALESSACHTSWQ